MRVFFNQDKNTLQECIIVNDRFNRESEHA